MRLDSPINAPPPAVRLGTVLAGHVLFTLVNAILFANSIWLVPLLVRLHFGAADRFWKDWQTTLITGAVPALMMSSIFWNEVLRRVRVRTYLALLWPIAALPLGCIGLAQNYWQLLACHVVATAGLAGWMPIQGKLLKHFYSDAIRGRVYALLNMVGLGAAIVTAYLIGIWMKADPSAFRIYFPLAAALQIVGIAILIRLARLTRMPDDLATEPAYPWSAVLRPVLHMGRVLRVDRTFMRYEQAFMTYGAAFMICEALLPVLATDRLHMRYEEYSHYGQVVFRLAMLVATLPMGWLLDRIGAIRTSGIAFGVLALYPVLLITAAGLSDLSVACAVYGLGLAGVQMGWMLGPVSLAGSPDRVSQYVAIHTTLVGVRGIIFQGLGMLIYKLTDSFVWPLALAAVAFFWAALQMRRLHGTLNPSGRSGRPRATLLNVTGSATEADLSAVEPASQEVPRESAVRA